jgi:NADP-dependent 3-hydroxy acid dehydrogenase YdfG
MDPDSMQQGDDAALPAELAMDPEQLPDALRPVERAPGVAVITGASSGIGAATALALARRGWALALVARRQERLSQVAAEVRRLGGHALTAAIDASDAPAVLALRDRTIARFGVPDAIVNSAGGGRWRWMEDTSAEELESMLDAPFRAAWHTTRAFLPDLLAAGRGVVVHVGSPGSLAAWPGATGYTTSRWALRGLHEALRQDLAGTGVRTCHVLFGEVTSEYFVANPDSQQHIPRVARIIPVISPERAAAVVVRTIDRPRAQVFHPWVLGLLQVANRLAPGLVALLARRTGRQR